MTDFLGKIQDAATDLICQGQACVKNDGEWDAEMASDCVEDFMKKIVQFSKEAVEKAETELRLN